MNKSILIVTLSFLLNTSFAQISVPIGKKMQLVTTQKLTNISSMMGQEVEFVISGTTNTDAEVKLLNNSSITFSATVKKITGSFNGMGQDQKFDSDDKNAKNNPMTAMLAPMLNTLNKPEDVVLMFDKNESTVSSNASISLENSKAVILQDIIMPKEAFGKSELYKWASETSSKETGSKSAIIYSITKVTSSEVEITVNETANIVGNVQMMGMDAKQNLTGTKTSILLYDASSKLLKASVQKLDFSGTMEAMGMNLPVKLNGTITTTVN